jgi:hypothetical protein
MKYIPRSCLPRLPFLLKSFPAVLLVEPRHCGKSTLARHVLPQWIHIDLERPLDFALLNNDLEGFLKNIQMGKEYLVGKVKQPDRVRGKDLISYWSVVELWISRRNIARSFDMAPSAVCYAV